ncbi:unnamed protein product [Candidula unifasciata]|uniref:Uncharacterized protein n=1 Tax=Candidula unifasciata TaxID=100452 RepID=A0A8S3ZFD3_9EUPU|nr:unnamed protein product [Candidula unifasciata]
MGIIRVSSHALRKLSASNRKACRSYSSHVSQPLYKTQQGVVLGQAQTQSNGWVIPAALAIVGLGVSTFSTQQLVSGTDTIKMFSSHTTAKQ